ncbi:MAG: tRNA 2-thiouridine(34) synthase MnmA [Acidobacteria bacterium]|nr:tRNA 2-thiouridine(34) synthase MnmA [Acidobacteriota bacterium]
MSGGVDSSVAAALLAEQGYDVIGLSMQLYDQSEQHRRFGGCCTLEDLHDARRVAAAIGIPHYILNLERQFDTHVVSNFVREYAAGRTPLPCAHCNSDLKFAALAERARGLGADRIATGHYARVECDEAAGRYRLLRGLDPAKDQSYFLFSLTQDQLGRAQFPVGGIEKTEVRARARQLGLAVADKPDSQEICFVPDHDYASFVARQAPEVRRGGPIVDEQGRVLGGHAGLHHFTVGQRKGLGLSRSSTGAPMYVVALRPAGREVVVGPRPSLERTRLVSTGVNWIDEAPRAWRPASVQIRHRHAAAPARVRALDDGRAEVEFDEPQIAVAPGQAAVFYDGDAVLGGGWIDAA